jgi:hypothetical protein
MSLRFVLVADTVTGDQCPVSTITAPELVFDLSTYAAEVLETAVCADPIEQAVAHGQARTLREVAATMQPASAGCKTVKS